jgi:hypothetical protein
MRRSNIAGAQRQCSHDNGTVKAQRCNKHPVCELLSRRTAKITLKGF